jgi:hypothetical protein
MIRLFQTKKKQFADHEVLITDLEIENMEQEQEITDHDIAIMEIQEAIEPKEG